MGAVSFSKRPQTDPVSCKIVFHHAKSFLSAAFCTLLHQHSKKFPMLFGNNSIFTYQPLFHQFCSDSI
ncbi:Uncharacterised protein [Mycobacteroides abscessus subsp. abscessus]|nr:Uncharacterised protein [Mycobacteroides abscessus subsp. abscessus]